MAALGVEVLERGKVAGKASADYVLFNTKPGGKYLLGLVLYTGADEVRPESAGVRPQGHAVRVRRKRSEAGRAVLGSLGFPEMTLHPSCAV